MYLDLWGKKKLAHPYNQMNLLLFTMKRLLHRIF